MPQGWVDLESERVVIWLIWLIRRPRVLVAALCGVALAVAGALIAGVFQNHLASKPTAAPAGTSA